jgi:drug/metabolite transporter (DMT)-like permease
MTQTTVQAKPQVSPEAPPATAAAGFTLTDLTLLFTVTIWGFNFVIVKAVLDVMSPLGFLAVRMVLAMVIMLGIYQLSDGEFRLPRREWLALLGLGLFGSTAYQLFFIHGLDRTTAGNAALIQAALPVVVAVVTHVLGSERLQPLAWLGVVLSFAGIYLVIRGGPNQVTFGTDSLVGDLLLVGAVASWATYTVLAKPVLARHPPLRVTAFSMLGGVPPLVLVSIPALMAEPWGDLPASAWLAVVYSGGLSIALSYLLWNRGLVRVGGARTSVYVNLVPVVAVLAAFFFLGESLSWLQLAGGAVIFAGIVLTRLRRRQQAG